MISGNFKVIKTIDLYKFEGQIDRVEQEITSFTDSCLEKNCTWNKDKIFAFNDEVLKLKHSLKAVYALLGRYMNKRSINFIGSAMKYLYGVMDHDDEEYIKTVLQDLGDRQDKLHNTVNSTVHLMKDMSQQWEKLKDNQQILFNNFLERKRFIEKHLENQKKRDWEIDYNNFEVHLNNLILSVDVQIDRLTKAILFLKTGVVDPYFVDSDELIKALTYQRIHYNVTPKDVDIILGNKKPVALLDVSSMRIHIIFLIPIAKEMSFNIYENLIIPKMINSDVVILDNISKYFVASFDNMHYFTTENLDCIKISKVYLCKRSITFKMGLERECITDLFHQNIDMNCNYKKLNLKFDAHNVLSSGLIMFSTSEMEVQLTCGVEIELKNFTGSYLMQPPHNCSINSTIFEFDYTESHAESHLTDRIPVISCCSIFFKNNISNSNEIEHIKFTSLHDIREIDATKLEKELSGWKKFRKVNFNEHVKTWHVTTTMIIIGLVAGIIIYCKLKNMCCKKQSNVVVSFKAEPTVAIDKPGKSGVEYPSFSDYKK